MTIVCPSSPKSHLPGGEAFTFFSGQEAEVPQVCATSMSAGGINADDLKDN